MMISSNDLHDDRERSRSADLFFIHKMCVEEKKEKKKTNTLIG